MKRFSFKQKLAFQPDILSKEYVLAHGVPYNDEFWQDDYELEELYDKAPDCGGKPFTGLLYRLCGDMLISYKFFRDGYPDGEAVRFYETGALKSYWFGKLRSPRSVLYQWFPDGKLKYYREAYYHRTVNAIRYDEAGNIVLFIEKGVSKEVKANKPKQNP